MDHLSGLNDRQKEAAVHKDGPLLIVAGAGAGKTKTLVHRIVNLILGGVAPENILAVTFTNKAAKEMRERIQKAVLHFGSEVKFSPWGLSQADEPRGSAPRARGDSDPMEEYFAKLPFVSTFHSLGVHILKENARMLGLNRYFSILDDKDSTALIKDCLRELGFDPKQYDPRKIGGIISNEKGKFVSLEEYKERVQRGGSNHIYKVVTQVWSLYENKKNAENGVDFDDLLLKTTKLLKENKDIRDTYQNKWQYIHIDEYQDTNEVQYLMSRLLSGENRNICVVGDADQNIYSWRGANLKNILNFEKDYPGAKIVLLEENYRSTKNILDAANNVIKKNKYRPEKNLFTENKEGEKISVYEALEENDEAEFVATKILEIWDFASPNFSSLYPSKSDGLRHDQKIGRVSMESEIPDDSVGDTFSQVLGKNPQTIRKSTSDFTEPEKIKETSAWDEAEKSFSNGDDAKQDILRKISLSEIAILYRTNFQSRVLEEAMLRYNIPYQVLGTKFFERKEIKDTLSYLRAALNRDSLFDIKRVINFPTRGIGKATIAKMFSKDEGSLPVKTKVKINNFYKILDEIKEKIEQEKPSEIIKFVVKHSGIKKELENGGEEDMERLENIKELATLALKYDKIPKELGIQRLLEDAALSTDQDEIALNEEKNKNKHGVKLMTVHASKGLEFDYVFITGLEDGLFPSRREKENKNEEDREEERRLFYVALTRAKKKVFLSFSNFRTIFGIRLVNTPSEFLNDIDDNLIEKSGEQILKTIYL